MDELETIRRFRNAVPYQDEQAKEVVRAALLELIQQSLAPSRGGARRLRRLWPVLAVLALAAVLVTSAWGLGARILDFVSGEPAPEQVKEQFARELRVKQISPLFERQTPGVIAEQARGVIAIESSAGPIVLWVAPTESGGYCYIVDVQAHPGPRGQPNGESGCDPSPQTNPISWIISNSSVGGKLLRLLKGHVAPRVASLEIVFAGGESEQLQLVDGFFLRELDTEEDQPTALIARDRQGVVLKRQPLRPPEEMLRFPGQNRVGPERTVSEIQTSAGYPMRLTIAPGESGLLCVRTYYRGANAGGCNPDPRDRSPAALDVAPGLWNETEDGKPVVLLQGSVGRDIARLDVRYQDGDTTRIPIHEGFVLFEVPRPNYGEGHLPATLIGRDASGAVIARRPVRNHGEAGVERQKK